MISNVCICGAGTMGTGIAQLAASSALPAILYELNSGALEKAKKTIDSNLELLVEKGKITSGQKEKIFQSVHFTHDLKECVADLIIEAIIENIDAKNHLFGQLATINDDKTIFATNTSSLSVTSIASKILQPRRFLGMHFFNPAPIMKLVEVINTDYTNKRITQVVTGMARQMGKVPVVCKDSPGFIVNRLARPYYIESLRLA